MMKVILKQDELDKDMVLMYSGDYLMGAAHVDNFDGLKLPVRCDVYGEIDYEAENIKEYLSDFEELECELRVKEEGE